MNGSASSRSRNHDQLLAIDWSTTSEIALFALDREAAQVEQVMQLKAIGPAQRHLARIFCENLSVSSDFPVAPHIATNLCEMVEVGAQHLADVAAPGHRVGAGKPWSRALVVDQQIETRIE
jgi:hypothetical protein